MGPKEFTILVGRHCNPPPSEQAIKDEIISDTENEDKSRSNKKMRKTEEKPCDESSTGNESTDMEEESEEEEKYKDAKQDTEMEYHNGQGGEEEDVIMEYSQEKELGKYNNNAMNRVYNELLITGISKKIGDKAAATVTPMRILNPKNPNVSGIHYPTGIGRGRGIN